MADPKDAKKKALQQLSQNQGVGDKILDYLDRMGAASRSGIYAAQDFNPSDPLAAGRAFAHQLTRPSSEAPTGYDIAERTGLENPYIKTAIATSADVFDPTPLGKLAEVGKGVKALAAVAPFIKQGGKFGKLIQTGLEETPALGKVIRTGLEEEPALGKVIRKGLEEGPKDYGKVIQTGLEEGPIKANVINQYRAGLPESKVETNLNNIFGQEETQNLYDQFPGIANRFGYGQKKVIVPKKLLKK